jgi:hypothetical protein
MFCAVIVCDFNLDLIGVWREFRVPSLAFLAFLAWQTECIGSILAKWKSPASDILVCWLPVTTPAMLLSCEVRKYYVR